jgi:hypothetical protein
MKRKLKIKPIYECLCTGRLQTKRFEFINQMKRNQYKRLMRILLKKGMVYLQLNKKKAKAEGKKCHAKTMWSQ